MRALLFAVAFGVCSTVAVRPAYSIDLENGKRLAERWCSGCHAVGAAQKSSTTEAPPFSEIVKKSDLSAASLALFLLNPHPKMPDMGLSREAAADIAAFIRNQHR